MRASKEYRRWVNKLRKLRGKKNGVIRGCYLDQPEMDLKLKSGKRVT